MIVVTATQKGLIRSNKKDVETTQEIIKVLISNGFDYHIESNF